MSTRVAFALVVLAGALGLAGCPLRRDVPCGEPGHCDLATGGACVAAATGTTWCAYPDPSCPDGLRFADRDVGDGVAGQCAAAGSATPDARMPPGDAYDPQWGTAAEVLHVNGGFPDRGPALSADGLELYFWRFESDPPAGEIFVATRTTRDGAFSTPRAVAEVNDPAGNEIGAVPSHSGRELLVNKAGLLLHATRASRAAAYGTPAPTGIVGRSYSLSADDLVLYHVAGCPPTHHDGDGPCLHRRTRSAVGAPWSASTVVAWPEGERQWNAAQVSSDQLHVLLSTPASGNTLPCAQASRTAIDQPWGPLRLVDAVSIDPTAADAWWSEDRAEIYFTVRPFNGDEDIHVAVAR